MNKLLLSAKDMAATFSISLRGFHNLRKDETFPKPIKLGEKTIRWKADAVVAWVASK